MNIGRVTSEFKRVEFENCAATWPLFNDHPSFGKLAWQNELEYLNFEFSMLTDNHFSTSNKNLVKFGLVTPELKT